MQLDVRQQEGCSQAEAGMDLKLEMLTDSTANLGKHNRIGSGRVRHLDVKWLREGCFLMESVFCGNPLSLILCGMCLDGIEQSGAWHETERGYLWILVGMDLNLAGSVTVLLTETWYLIDL